ncbi:hypothetical protein CEXT_374781 [Caerostris extrusa]|uniref:Uncharacterized protein n=1 Tax=Caerostris extrusa TaxID=172846 RepID=A0AAV4NBH9_CAEEX|nr:hypothetical protein CEXT_374781 [Caerostris extrusa]
MISVHYGRNREVVNICYDRDNIKLNIKESLQRYHRMMNYVLRNKKFANKSPYFEVRWTEFKDPENENCCFLYAHWLNTDGPIPMGNYRLPGEEIVDRNKKILSLGLMIRNGVMKLTF